MTTYTHPHTFCWIVCELMQDRGWKIRKAQSSGQLGVISLRIPDGTTVVSGVGGSFGLYDALTKLCEKFVAEHKIPIKWDRDAFKEKYGEPDYTKAKHDGWNPESHVHDEARDPFDSVFDEMFRQYAKSSNPFSGFDWGPKWGPDTEEKGTHGTFRGVNAMRAMRDSELWKKLYREHYGGKPAHTASERTMREQTIDQLYDQLKRTGEAGGYKYYKHTF